MRLIFFNPNGKKIDLGEKSLLFVGEIRASKGIDFVSFYATNQTAGISRTLRIDGLRFEKKPLKVTVFPEEEVEVISREKLEEWRNKSAEELIGMLGKGYKVRIEIRGME